MALDDVTFETAPGQIHALLGENGAGKSTLMHIAYGMLRPDRGMVEVSGPAGSTRSVPGLPSPAAARAAGIGMVHQHFTSIPAFTVSENIALTAGWNIAGRATERRAAEVIERTGLPLPVSALAESLSVQLRQRLEIVKALAADASILLLDEPTAVLAPREVGELLAFLRRFAAAGGTVVLITHKLDEVVQVADRVTVLRRGVTTLSSALADQTPQSLARAMIGDDIPGPESCHQVLGDVLIRADDLTIGAGSHSDGSARQGIASATFQVRAGEIIGVAGIEGNGQRGLMRALANVDQVVIAQGTLTVHGPVAFVPEDRTTEGLIPSFTLAENLLLGTLDRSPFWLNWPQLHERTRRLLQEYDVRATGSHAPAGAISGGNQQKFVLGRALERRPRVIVAENPTRGLDVLAAMAIHERLRQAADQGAAVIVHSSDLDEVLEIADRIFVVAGGRLRELPRHSSRQLVGDAMLGLDQST